MDLKGRVTSSLVDLLLAAPIDIEKYETLYKHFHEHPELSNLEASTAKTIAVQLSSLQAFNITAN
jgi:metal-dependent amidase/aminoacylase/carboxypeptidase family protein